MCGISGAYSFSAVTNGRLELIGQTLKQLKDRGPDASGVFRHQNLALGHCRLAVIDTSDAASQPMSDPTGRYCLVFNGEIFNYKDLSERYLKGYQEKYGRLKTHSDTEVLLGLLIEYGVDCLNWLQGFFAFAFYDKETWKLLLARDRFGKKPLVIYRDEEFLAFASEMKSLMAWGIPRKLDYTVLHQYLQLNYVPQPQSMLKGVFKLKQGHYMIVGTAGVEQEQPYFQLQTHPERYDQLSYEDAKSKLVTLMDQAVRDRMISDVSLGAFLSGGIDSSVVVALASRHTDKLHTFSVGYKDNPYFDETRYAKLVADKYKTDHTVFSLSNNDFLEHVYGVLDYIDEPFADSSAIPVYILSKHTRQSVTVALSGDGGDEVFAGYNKHMGEWQMRRKSLTKNLVSDALPLWKLLPKSRNNLLTNTFRKIHRFAEAYQLPTKERYWRLASFMNTDAASSLLTESARHQVAFERLRQEKEQLLQGFKTDDFNEVLLSDMNLVLLSDMLVKVDLMSMANSLEVRSPFLDPRVVDFAFGLPSEYKIDGKMKKKILQDAFRDLLPAAIYNRPKHGFEIPLLDWFRNELWGLIDNDLLAQDFVVEQGIFNPQSIQQLKQKLRSSNPGDSHATIWALLVFQYWWKKYLS